MKNIRTTIGGALGAFGTSLIGVGVLGMSNPADKAHSELLWWVAFSGFILSCLGKLFNGLFAADSKQLCLLQEQVDNSSAKAPKSPP